MHGQEIAKHLRADDRPGLFLSADIKVNGKWSDGCIVTLQDRAIIAWFTGTLRIKNFDGRRVPGLRPAPYGQPPAAPQSRRGPRPWLVAGVAVTVLGTVGGAVATALVLTGDEEPVAAEVRPVAEEEPSVDDGSHDKSGAADSPSRSFEEAPTEPAPSGIPDGFFSEGDPPVATMRTHWANIAVGDYGAAYHKFVASYSGSLPRSERLWQRPRSVIPR